MMSTYEKENDTRKKSNFHTLSDVEKSRNCSRSICLSEESKSCPRKGIELLPRKSEEESKAEVDLNCLDLFDIKISERKIDSILVDCDALFDLGEIDDLVEKLRQLSQKWPTSGYFTLFFTITKPFCSGVSMEAIACTADKVIERKRPDSEEDFAE